MSLQFILGTSTNLHEDELVRISHEWLAEHEAGEVYFLVPNYMKFESELRILRKLGNFEQKEKRVATAKTRLQVLSFTRLAWFLMNTETREVELSEEGRSMLFRKILLENKENLTLFRGEFDKKGFMASLMDFFAELEQGTMTANDLEKIIHDESKGMAQRRKFAELLLLYNAYSNARKAYNLSEESLLSRLAKRVRERDLSNVLVVVHGYTRFSSEELSLLRAFMKQARELKISMLSEKVGENDTLQPLELFYDSKKTIQRILRLAKEEKVKILIEKYAPKAENTRLLAIENAWRNASDNGKFPLPDFDKTTVQIWQSENHFVEIHRVAKEIHRLVSEEGYRYKDIQVLVRNMEDYHTQIAPIFEWNNIPLTMDRRSTMKSHPLVEFFQSLFRLKEFYFQYEDVIRLLRSELFTPLFQLSTELGNSLDLFSEIQELTQEEWQLAMEEFRDTVDITENIVLQYGYNGRDWTSQKDWRFVTYDFEENEVSENRDVQKERRSNELRRFVGGNLSLFFKEMENVQTVREGAECFYRFLTEIGLDRQMTHFRDSFAATDIAKAKEYEQAWSAFVHLLEEYVFIFGEDTFDWATFSDIFSTGLENGRYGKVPAVLDTVQVISSELVQPMQSKVVFALGLTNHTLPMSYENKSILTLEERTMLEEVVADEKFFMNDVNNRNAKEIFVAYMLFTSASEKLYLTAPKQVEGAKETRLSPFVERFSKALGIAIVEKKDTQLLESDALSQISTYRLLIRDLVRLKQFADENEETPSILWNMLEEEVKKSDFSELYHHALLGLEKKNIPHALSHETTELLYGDNIEASVSRFELLHQCEFKHFANYGLQLKGREILDLNPAMKGNFFHEALDEFFKLLQENQLDIEHLNEEQLLHFTEQVIEKTLAIPQFDLLNRDSRMRYLRFQLSEVTKRVLWAVKQQADRSGLKTKETELIFGKIAGQKGIEGLTLALSNDKVVKLRGKIDRLDVLEQDRQQYLSVVDYKSGAKKFDLLDSYYGLAMQMVTYLDVATSNATAELESKPLGAFYLHLQNPTLDYDEKTLENLDENILKEFKVGGLLVNYPEAIPEMDKTLDGKASILYPVQQLKSGEVKGTGSNFFTEDEFATIAEHNRQNFTSAAEKIYSGDIALNPVRQGTNPRACSYCSFKSVCFFDPMLKENQYKKMEPFGDRKEKKAKILEAMKIDLESGEKND
ncbi:ATP-dependent helicase/nuclease subunit B [Pilibacter termitis]|uniref:ATP-dependent helicase/nuclease subunit B n=1 Tax=Pilibacter termitis TaxID=263852 RepID=A0A1T4M5Y3_9ENTE|nr:PD-(D/E)XK nuclease family protein [Pilibacter termitis]SJZ62332.1 ATP-dependent helicase/nuclease subunit B [Pilibacter termitis]